MSSDRTDCCPLEIRQWRPGGPLESCMRRQQSKPIYTDDIQCTVPDAPIIPIDPEEIGMRLVMAELELNRLRVIIEGLLHRVARHWG